ncbi:MAG: helix-turn-helix transcriptional regulator [Gemmatimonadaceae bacterium]|nr:helix-turn-helix transcriptional regulator [Gemmatimonadaceae bacterium]
MRAGLAGKVAVEFTSSWRECQERLLDRAGVTLLVPIPSARETDLLEQLVSIRERFPHVAMVGLFVEGVSDLSATAKLGARGVSDVITSSRIGAGHALLDTLSHSETEGVATRLWRLAHLDVNDECATLLRTTLRLAHQPVTLPQLARAARMHERTLRKYCEQYGMPSPQHIIGWARCLMVAYYLEEEGRTIQSIAGLLAFPSPALMANHIRRYTRQTPRDLRAYGAVRIVGRMFEAQIIKTAIPEIPRAATVGEAREAAPRPKLRLI